MVDGSSVLMSDYETQSIKRAPKTGGAATLVGNVPYPSGLTADNDAVYVTSFDGAVYKIAK